MNTRSSSPDKRRTGSTGRPPLPTKKNKKAAKAAKAKKKAPAKVTKAAKQQVVEEAGKVYVKAEQGIGASS